MAQGTLTVQGHDLHLTNLEKVLWPDDHITKAELLEYYQNISPYILPYLKNRPIMLHRYPNGINHEGFYQKDISKEPPPKWVKIESVEHTSGRHVDYVLVQNKATLLYVVNLGSIDLHPFEAQIGNLMYPDYFVLDLDPNEIDFERVIEVAQLIYQLLSEAGIKCYCKTSGSRGLHIYVPLARHFNYDQAKQIAQQIATQAHHQLPMITTLEHSKINKRNKVYLDYLRNNWTQTTVAVYSVRPKPHAPVATPLMWKEVKKGLDPNDFTIKTIFKRLDKVGDIFKPILGKANLKELKKFL